MASEYAPTRRTNVSAYFPLDINMMVSAFIRSLQDRSIKAASETATGSMIINTLVEFVVGQGLEAQSSPENTVLQWDDETRSRFVSQAESFFRQYAGSRRIDHYGKMNFYQTQKVVFQNGLKDGDFLLHRSYRNGHHDYEPYFQVLSGKWVRNPNMQVMDTKILTGGVEFDDAGREVAYWIGETLEDRQDSFQSRRVWKYNSRANNFEEFNLVRFGIREANQVRGIPVLTPILEDIFNLEEFKVAYRMKAATQALFTGIITSEKDAPAPAVSTIETIKNLQTPVPREVPEALPNGNVDDIALGTGNIIALNPGEKFDMAESKVPAADYKQYMETELPQITAAVGLSSEMALQKYNNNYSASRATIAGQEKKFKNYRDELAEGFCTPVWEQVIDWAIRKGYIEAPGYIEGDWRYKQAVLAVTWIGPSPINIDPKKEVEAHILAIDAGLETREQACRELFQTDYEETVDRIKKEQEMAPPAPTEVRNINITRDDEENT